MEKKLSYRQLEKQNKNGRELLHRVTLKASMIRERMENLEAQLYVAQSFVGYLAKNNPDIDKAEMSNYLKTKSISWEATETGYRIISKDREPEPETETET